MANEKKNAKYWITRDKPNLQLPSYRRMMDPRYVKRVLHLDEDAASPGQSFTVRSCGYCRVPQNH
jgi:hypothetical protein